MKTTIKTFSLLFVTILLFYGMYVTLPMAWNIVSSLILQGVNTETPITTTLPFSGGQDANTGAIATGTISIPSYTGATNSGELSFLEILEKGYSGVIYNLPMQPLALTEGMSYNDRSQLLIDYMTKNTIRIPSGQLENAYMYIKLRKTPVYPIFIYWHNSTSGYGPRSGDLDLLKAKEKISDTEYIFDVSNVPYVRFYDKNHDFYQWKSDINRGKSLFVAFSSKGFDGNGVEQMIFYMDRNKNP